MTRLHAALGEEETARVWALGRNAPLDKLVHEALGRMVTPIPEIGIVPHPGTDIVGSLGTTPGG